MAEPCQAQFKLGLAKPTMVLVAEAMCFWLRRICGVGCGGYVMDQLKIRLSQPAEALSELANNRGFYKHGKMQMIVFQMLSRNVYRSL